MKTIRVNKPPPVNKRPRCPQCTKPLRPMWATIAEKRGGGPNNWEITVEWKGNYNAYGNFCTLRCTERYANAVVNKLQGFAR